MRVYIKQARETGRLMTSWENQFQDMKNQFVQRSHERLITIEAMLAQLQTNPHDLNLLRDVMKNFHWLAGSGGTYGFDEITQWGTYGEELCDYLLKLQVPVAPADQEKLVTALRTVQQLFQAQMSLIQQNTEVQTRSSSELMIPPGALMNSMVQDASARSSQTNSSTNTASYTRPMEQSTQTASAPPPTSHPGAAFPAASNASNSLFPPVSGPPGSGSAFPASPNAVPVRQPDAVTSAQFPAQTWPGQPAETTRILGSGASGSLSPSIAAPPLSVGTQNSTQVLPPDARTFPHTGESRKPARLAHIPTDRKFAILVDANLSNLTPIKSTLEERGLLVEGFTSASEVKSCFPERLPDVLIVGAPLIDNNGYELVEHLRSLDGGHKPIIILLGQQAAFLDKVQAIRAGADAFFEYPAELSDLTDKIHALLDRDKNENYKILSVEDDPDQANFIKLTLQSAGYTVLHLADPSQFEEQFLSFEPDLVMLDVLLGDLTGFELAKYIRQNDRFATLPIVFLTTQNKLHQHIRSAIAGGDEHLVKPVAPQLLIATVASRLERARSLKRLIDRDGLTRCLNYGSFMERAQKLATLDGYRSAPAMMMIDVDNMKRINEKLGFAAGDRIISNIASMLLKGFRNTDLIARFGNDQFAIVLEHLNAQQLQSLSSQVLGAISGTPQLIKGKSVTVTCSGGVAVLEQGMSVQEWLAAAQDALKKAKDAGGNRALVRPTLR